MEKLLLLQVHKIENIKTVNVFLLGLIMYSCVQGNMLLYKKQFTPINHLRLIIYY